MGPELMVNNLAVLTNYELQPIAHYSQLKQVLHIVNHNRFQQRPT